MKLTLGFIGLGVMGKPMAEHLLAAGYPLHIYNRTQAKADSLIQKGAVWQSSPQELAPLCNVIFTMVGFPADVEQTYLGEQGLLKSVRENTLLIDLTTSKPTLAQKIAFTASQKNCSVLDAPVSGGDTGARNATLSIMVGGSKEAFQRALPLLEIMGKQITYMGEAGMGQHTKMSNQITIASNMMGVCEALIYAEKSGLDPAKVLSAISAGAAGSSSLINLGPRILQGDFAPGFYIKHFIKDMVIALESAKDLNLSLPSLELSHSLYCQLAEEGLSDQGTQALFKWYQTHQKGEFL